MDGHNVSRLEVRGWLQRGAEAQSEGKGIAGVKGGLRGVLCQGRGGCERAKDNGGGSTNVVELP